MAYLSASRDGIDGSNRLARTGLPRSARRHLLVPVRSQNFDGTLLPFGERHDGAIVHIADVPRGLACDCRCSGCDGVLVARKGKVKEHHFAHQSAAPCAHAFESALHKLAKQILNEKLMLLLPRVAAARSGEEVIECEEREFSFDRAEIEVPFPGFQPDVVLYKGERRLLVEVLVTHATDETKEARIAASGLAAVEIDLSGISRDADIPAVADALCRSAPRWWIYNQREQLAAAKLDARLADAARRATEAAERARQREERRIASLAQRIAHAHAGPKAKLSANASMRRVKQAGLADVLGSPVRGDECFAVSPQEWQSALVEQVILTAIDQPRWASSGSHPSDVFKNAKIASMLKRGMPSFVAAADRAALLALNPDFRTPYEVVEAFLDRLGAAGLLELRRKRWHPSDEAYRRVGRSREAEQAIATRREQLVATVQHIVNSVRLEERRGFVLADWLGARQPMVGLAPLDAVRHDDQGRRLLRAATDLKLMLLSRGPLVTETLGLPVEPASERERRKREQEAIAAVEARRGAEAAAAEAERLAALQAAGDRTERLRGAASAGLEADAAAWLGRRRATGDLTYLQLASRDEAGLAEALRALRPVVEERRRLAEVAHLRDLLRAQARDERSRLFLNSANPRFLNQRPIDFCCDERSFTIVMKELAIVTGGARR